MGRFSSQKKWLWCRQRSSGRGRPSKQTKVRLLSDRSCNFMITHIMQLISACETTPETSLPGLRAADNSPTMLPDTEISLSELHANLTLPDKTWVDQSTVDAIKICRIHYNQSSDSVPFITHSLTIDSDLCWTARIHNQSLSSQSCSPLKQFPSKISSSTTLNRLINTLHTGSICIGNPDFVSVVRQSINTQLSAAFIDNLSVSDSKGTTYTETVRTSSCEMLLTSEVAARCSACSKYRGALRSIRSRQVKRLTATPTKRTAPSSHVNWRYLRTPKKTTRMVKRSAQVRSATLQVQRLKEKLQAVTAKEGLVLQDDLQDDFSALFEEQTSSVMSKHKPGSFQRLFWEQQAEALKKPDKRQIRWHPMIIKWCLSLKLLSSACYSSMRSSGVVVLPSERTLRDYTHFVKAQSGFSAGVDEQLKTEARMESSPEYQRHVCLIFDEVKIKEDLVYNKYTGELIGFINLGEVNECLNRFEQACMGTSQQPQLANHMLVFMVCGLLSDLEFPYAQFPSASISADQLYSLVWGCVRHLEAIGLKVLAATCDGASPNRKFFRMHGPTNELVYKTTNIYSSAESRPLFFLSDVPHLIKTVRNCWANSFAHGYSRKLWVRNYVVHA